MDLQELPTFWSQFAKDFPEHPAVLEPSDCINVPLVIYGQPGFNALDFFCGPGAFERNKFGSWYSRGDHVNNPGDEAQALNESWMCLTFTCACSPYRTFSRASRFLITMVPTAAYSKNEEGINITLQEAAKFITASFCKLALGVSVADIPSEGGQEAS